MASIGLFAHHSHEYALADPEIIPASQALEAYPLPVRIFIRVQGTTDYVWLHRQT